MSRKKKELHTVLLTGASGGLGRALTHRLTAAGCTVIGLGRDEKKLSDLKNSLGGQRALFLPVAMDICDHNAWVLLIERLQKEQLLPDTVIQNAGILPPFARFDSTDPALFQKTIETDFLAPVASTRLLCSVLAPQSSFCFIGSSNALCPMAGTGAYSAAKGALCNWAECLSEEWRGRFNVCTAYLGFINTDIFRYQNHTADSPLIRLIAADPDRVAKKILRAIRRKKKRMISGVDARLMCVFSALFPVFALRLYRFAMKKSGLPLFQDLFLPFSDENAEQPPSL